MSTHFPGFQSFFRFLHHFVLAKLATSSIRVKLISKHLVNSEIPGGGGGGGGAFRGRIRSLSKFKNTPKALISGQKSTLF